ncbi:MAG: serine/threonine protein kinase [Phycisphaeraceae bacterium]|nr:serine/threonine protein kinase [Phycisphaeraceae bacterium]
MADAVARVLALYRREASDPPFERVVEVLRAEGLVDDVHSIEIDAEVRRLLGRERSVERWRSSFRRGPDRELVLDAAVTASLGDHLDDPGFPEMARRVAALGPEFAAAVARLRLVHAWIQGDETVGVSGTAHRPSDPDARDALEAPCSFGPPCAGHNHRFDLRRELGTGSSGQVFEAIDRRYSDGAYRHVVVVKVLPPHLAHRAEPELLRGSRVQHPSVVRWLDSGVAPDGRGFVVSELVAGRTLEDPGVLSVLGRRGAVDVVRQIAQAVAAAHSAGVLHLDVKPANILVSESGEARLCDFGAAQPTDLDAASIQSTPFFASPEVLDGAPAGPAADIYALGAVLRWCADGLDAIDAPPSPRADADRLESIWRRAMAPDPASRPPTAQALTDDLSAWLAHRPLPSEVPSIAASLQLSVRRDPVTWVLGASALVAVTLVAWLWIDGLIEESRRRADRLATEARQLRAQAALSQYVDSLGDLARADGLSTAPQVLAMQWLVGERGIPDSDLASRTVEAQRSGWAALIESATARGRRDHLEAKLAAVNLALTDLERASAGRALALMTEDLPWWRERFAEDDPIRRSTEAVAYVASILADLASARADRANTLARLEAMGADAAPRDPRLALVISRTISQVRRDSP